MYSFKRNKHTIVIYVLYWDPEELKREKEEKRYSQYPWARPILMTHQDATFENAFWEQLRELSHEWRDVDRVGVIGANAFKKINIQHLNKKIATISTSTSTTTLPPITFFMDSREKVNSVPEHLHPHLRPLLLNALRDLQLPFDSTMAYCNYWMATPALMSRFLEWEVTICRPYLKSRPFIWADAKYTSTTPLAKGRLIALWGNPFYPHYPFVMERLVKAFFLSIIVRNHYIEADDASPSC
jgi:hypothetical protein